MALTSVFFRLTQCVPGVEEDIVDSPRLLKGVPLSIEGLTLIVEFVLLNVPTHDVAGQEQKADGYYDQDEH